MSREVVLTPEARTDLREAYLWYHEQDAAVAEQFLESVEGAMRAAANSPLHYPIRFDRFRRIVLRRFPYVIFYDHDDTALYVYYIFHGAQNPVRLRDRLS
jgi:plasmid stabilization system protein ParE